MVGSLLSSKSCENEEVAANSVRRRERSVVVVRLHNGNSEVAKGEIE